MVLKEGILCREEDDEELRDTDNEKRLVKMNKEEKKDNKINKIDWNRVQ